MLATENQANDYGQGIVFGAVVAVILLVAVSKKGK